MKQKILNQVGVLLTCSILITFLVVSLVMYNRFNGYMMQSVRNETDLSGSLWKIPQRIIWLSRWG